LGVQLCRWYLLGNQQNPTSFFKILAVNS